MKPPIFNSSWPENVHALYRHDLQEIWDSSIARHVWNQYHNQLRLYLSLAGSSSSLKILDVGCAQGTLALLLAERGHRVWALDIRQDFLDYAVSRHERGEVHFVCGNVLEVELEDRFDLIFCNQTIEHLVHPEKLIRRLHQCLVQAGRLVVTTPNGLYLKNSLPSFSELGDVSQYEDRQYFADGDGHFFAYRENELLEIFRNSGLQRVFVKYFESPWISGHMKIRYLHSILPATMLQMMDGITLNLPGLSKRLTHQLLVLGYR